MNLITKQINSSPQPLRDYVRDLESFGGETAHIIQENFQLREQNKQLVKYLELFRKEDQ
jgi:hypothetical protein